MTSDPKAPLRHLRRPFSLTGATSSARKLKRMGHAPQWGQLASPRSIPHHKIGSYLSPSPNLITFIFVLILLCANPQASASKDIGESGNSCRLS